MVNIGKYTIKSQVSVDQFGNVLLARNYNTGEDVTIRGINLTGLKDRSTLNDEVTIGEQLSMKDPSEFILRYIESFNQTYEGSEYKFIVTEFIKDSRSLASFIETDKGRLSPSVLWPIMLQLILGLKYIHDRGYALRNISSENIIISGNRIKFVPFKSTCFDKCYIGICRSTCRNPSPNTNIFYRPPEDFNGTKENSLICEKAGDIWALSMVFFELVHGPQLFPFIVRKADNVTLLPDYEIATHILLAPEFKSSYSMSDRDGRRTNNFLDSLVLKKEWRTRPKINDLQIMMMNLLTYVWNAA